MVKNTVLTYRPTYIGFGTKNLAVYNAIMAHNNHTVYTGRENAKDMNIVQNKLKVSTEEYIQWNVNTSFLPCSCPACTIHPTCGTCIYKKKRNIQMYIFTYIQRSETYDEFVVSE